MIMIAGIVLLMLGFLIMTMETAQYGFGPYGLTIGPVLLLIGFIVEIFAILYRPKSNEPH